MKSPESGLHKTFRALGLLSVLAFVLLLLPGCYASVYVEGRVPAEVDAFARGYIELIRTGELEEARKLVVKENVSPQVNEKLRRVHDDLVKGEIRSIEIVNHRRMKAPFEHTVYNTFSYEIVQEGRNLQLDAMTRTIDGVHRIFGLMLQPLERPLAEIHAFTFSGKPLKHYLVLLFAAASFSVIVYASVQCVRSRVERWWLWLIFILFGYGTVTLNWTTGAIDWHILSFWFLGGAPLKSGVHGPWLVTFSFPIVAIVFLTKLRGGWGGMRRPVGVEED